MSRPALVCDASWTHSVLQGDLGRVLNRFGGRGFNLGIPEEFGSVVRLHGLLGVSLHHLLMSIAYIDWCTKPVKDALCHRFTRHATNFVAGR